MFKNMKVIEEIADIGRSSDPNETREDYIKRMVAVGYQVDFPKDNELQIDIDSEINWATFNRSWEIFKREIEDYTHKKLDDPIITESKGGPPGRHIRITVPFNFLTSLERIAWQAALGSDPVRELLSAIRVLKGDKHPTLLVENGQTLLPTPKQMYLLEALKA